MKRLILILMLMLIPSALAATVSHPASNITPGTFTPGTYIFKSNLTGNSLSWLYDKNSEGSLILNFSKSLKRAIGAYQPGILFDVNSTSGIMPGLLVNFEESNSERMDVGWGGSSGGNMEFYSYTHPTRPGQFRITYGGGDFGNILFYHYDAVNWTIKAGIDKNGDFFTGYNGYYYPGSGLAGDPGTLTDPFTVFNQATPGTTPSKMLRVTSVGNAILANNLTANDVILPWNLTTNPPYKTLNDLFRLYESPGRLTGGSIVSNGDGTVNVTAGTGLIRIADDDVSQLYFMNWSTATLAIPNLSTVYVGVEYNGGAPRVTNRTSFSWNKDTEFSLGRVINEQINNNNGLHVISNPWWVGDSTANIIERFRAFGRIKRDDYIGGLILSATGIRQISVTNGTLWSNLNEFDIGAINTNTSGTIEVYWHNSTGHWFDQDQSQYNVTHYNPAGAGLTALNNNYYANWWVYAEADDKEIAMIYPQAQYSSAAAAEAESPPSTLPSHISQNGILIGRILIKQNTNAPVETQSAFSTVFSASAASDHGNLAGLADDDHTQYVLNTGDSLTGNLTFTAGNGLNASSIQNPYWVDTISGVNGYIPMWSDSNTLSTSLGPRLYEYMGSLGINTLSPTFMVDINGTTRITGNLTITDTILGNLNASYIQNPPWLTIIDNSTLTNRIIALESSNSSMDTRMDNMESSNITQANAISELVTSNGTMLPKSGGTMSGSINMGSKNVTAVDCIIFSSGGKICSGS